MPLPHEKVPYTDRGLQCIERNSIVAVELKLTFCYILSRKLFLPLSYLFVVFSPVLSIRLLAMGVKNHVSETFHKML